MNRLRDPLRPAVGTQAAAGSRACGHPDKLVPRPLLCQGFDCAPRDLTASAYDPLAGKQPGPLLIETIGSQPKKVRLVNIDPTDAQSRPRRRAKSAALYDCR